MAVHPTSGKFVWFQGPFTRAADATVFNEGGSARAFYDERTEEFTGRGLADRGYTTKNKKYDSTRELIRLKRSLEVKIVSQCLERRVIN